MLGRLGVIVAALALTVPGAGAQEAVPVLAVTGDGNGHGVGMAQDGAYWLGRDGRSTAEILGHFYVGTALGRAEGAVRVVVLVDDDADTTLWFPGGGQVRSPLQGEQAPGFPIDVAPGESVRIRFDGTYRVTPSGGTATRAARVAAQLPPLPSTSSTTAPTPSSAPPTTTPTAPPSPTSTTAPADEGPVERTTPSSVWAVPPNESTIALPDRQARYRGVVEATAATGPLRIVNQLDVEQYLRGMGEVRDPSWPAAALGAQATVARTYALRAMAANGEICDTQRCQVYLGQQAEYGAMDRAVAATAGQVVTWRGRLASTVYSAHGAGQAATPSEGFAQPDAAHPYLQPVEYPSRAPQPWEMQLALTDIAARLSYPGDLEQVEVVATGGSGRPLTVRLDGSAGERDVPAAVFTRTLGLRSSRWTARPTTSDAPPPPPPPATEIVVQDLPEVSRPRPRPRPAAPAPREGQPDPAPDWLRWPLVATVLLAGAYGVAALRQTREEPGSTPGPSAAPEGMTD